MLVNILLIIIHKNTATADIKLPLKLHWLQFYVIANVAAAAATFKHYIYEGLPVISKYI